MQTIRRDIIKRMVAKGNMEASSANLANSFVDSKWLPARIKAGTEDFKEGFMNLTDFDFKSSSGYAYRIKEGVFGLSVHSNQFFTLRVKEM